MIRAMIAHANTAILRSQFSVTVRAQWTWEEDDELVGMVHSEGYRNDDWEDKATSVDHPEASTVTLRRAGGSAHPP